MRRALAVLVLLAGCGGTPESPGQPAAAIPGDTPRPPAAASPTPTPRVRPSPAPRPTQTARLVGDQWELVIDDGTLDLAVAILLAQCPAGPCRVALPEAAGMVLRHLDGPGTRLVGETEAPCRVGTHAVRVSADLTRADERRLVGALEWGASDAPPGTPGACHGEGTVALDVPVTP